MEIPTATYRVQLNKDFRFENVRTLLPYLEGIGISCLYISPVFQARKGSTHGYDITNPCIVNPELGSADEFDALIEDLKNRGMDLLLDIVPNHMAASLENPWWVDVLENGPASPYVSFFDVEWEQGTPAVQDTIVLPVLGEPYGDALESQKLQLVLRESGFRVNYSGSEYPLDPATYHSILSYRLDQFLRDRKQDDPALGDLGLVLEISERLPQRQAPDWEALESRRSDGAKLKSLLWQTCQQHASIREHLETALEGLNGQRGDSGSFDALDHILEQQPYRLTFWRAARERINYRRFFDVSDLIGIRTQDPKVFEATHALTFQWVQEKKVAGLRIDHVDGLYDPLAYLAQLQERASKLAGEPIFIPVEKILCNDETLPNEWPVAGTTGYDFLGAVNNLFVDPKGLLKLTGIYGEFIAEETSFYEIAYAQKKKVMEDLFAGELRSLGLHVNVIAERYRHARDLSPEALSQAVLEVTASMPVYRTYMRPGHVGSRDRTYIEDAIGGAHRRNPTLNPACFQFLRRLFLQELKDDEDAVRLVMRWQQLTGPVMAKGVEDTTLYLYNRLVSMNEVGGSPEPVSVQRFHDFNAARGERWPATMNATSTHDTKRSEDVRARINTLSEMPSDWGRYVKRWSRWNRSWTQSEFPRSSANQEYLFYQTLVGTWPLDDEITAGFVERIKNYMIKSSREAKSHTSWLAENQAYEKEMLQFVEKVLEPSAGNRFLPHFRNFQKRTAFYGAVNSLAQTVLKLVAPGLPDFYQGTTFWDFSLVDPDNRRNAQILPRLELLNSFAEWSGSITAEITERLLKDWQDGRVKVFAIFRALQLRKKLRDFFANSEYISFESTGTAQEHTVSIGRKRGELWAIAVVPRFITGFSALEKFPLGRRIWKDSAIRLPDEAPSRWRNVFTDEIVVTSGSLLLADALKSFPVAIMTSEAPGSVE